MENVSYRPVFLKTFSGEIAQSVRSYRIYGKESFESFFSFCAKRKEKKG